MKFRLTNFHKIDIFLSEINRVAAQDISSFLVQCPINTLPKNHHSGQAKRDTESRIIGTFWIPAFTGMTDQM
jgi:hypothetical protein